MLSTVYHVSNSTLTGTNHFQQLTGSPQKDSLTPWSAITLQWMDEWIFFFHNQVHNSQSSTSITPLYFQAYWCHYVGDRNLHTLDLPERLVTIRMALIVPCSLQRSSSVSLVAEYGRPEMKILCFSIDVWYLKTCQKETLLYK